MHHLVIGDTHLSTKENDPLERAKMLRREILATRPDNIIFIGDFLDMGSLSFYDKPGSQEKENLRINNEINLAKLWMFLVFDPKGWPKGYTPDIDFTEGNHEYRLRRLFEQQAVFDGIISIRESLQQVLNEKCSQVFTWTPYGEYLCINKIMYTHVPFKNGQPVASTVNHTGMSLQLVDRSVIYGHTHRLEVKQALRAGSFQLITALNVGCYFDYIPSYVKNSNPHWWRGVVHVYPDGQGNFDFATKSMEALR